MQKGTIKIAKKMIELGIQEEQVMQATNLTKEEIEELKKEI